MKKTLIVLFSLSIISCGDRNAPSLNPTQLVWDVVTPESVGMSSSGLEQAFDYVFQDLHTVVIKDGKLVYERYRGDR